jgi:hypothetical protein
MVPAIVVDRAGYKLTELGLEPKRVIHFEEWETLGQWLGQFNRGIQWVLGDWLAYAEGRGDWTDKYSQALDVTGLEYQTLANYRWVAVRIPLIRRRVELSWSHHRLVAGIEDIKKADAWLKQAIAMKWTHDEFKAQLHKYDKPKVVGGQKDTQQSTNKSARTEPSASSLERLKTDYLALSRGDRLAFIDWLEEYHVEAGERTKEDVAAIH